MRNLLKKIFGFDKQPVLVGQGSGTGMIATDRSTKLIARFALATAVFFGMVLLTMGSANPLNPCGNTAYAASTICNIASNHSFDAGVTVNDDGGAAATDNFTVETDTKANAIDTSAVDDTVAFGKDAAGIDKDVEFAGTVEIDGTLFYATSNGTIIHTGDFASTDLDGIIGSNVAAAGTFTTVDGSIGSITPAAGVFTSLTTSTDLAITEGGTGSSTASDARTALDVDQAGTDNSTDVTLAGTPDYITISGQIITRGSIDLTADVSGDLPVTEGGTGSSTASDARTALGVAIGSDVQAFDATILVDADIGVNVQAFDADLTALAGVGTAVEGDLIIGGTGTWSRLVEGTDAFVLTLVGGVPAWAAAPSGGVSLSGSTNNTIATVTGSNALIGEATLTYDGEMLGINETSNAKMNAGITVDTLSDGTESFAAKASGVLAHGLTSIEETDTYWSIAKLFGGTPDGGIRFTAMGEDHASLTTNMSFRSYGGTADTTKTTGSQSLMQFIAWEHNGSNTLSNITANGNVFGIRAYVGGTTRTLLILDEDGDLHLDGSGTINTFDAFDDLALIRDLRLCMTRGQNTELNARYNSSTPLQYSCDEIVELGFLSEDISPYVVDEMRPKLDQNGDVVTRTIIIHDEILNVDVEITEDVTELVEVSYDPDPMFSLTDTTMLVMDTLRTFGEETEAKILDLETRLAALEALLR